VDPPKEIVELRYNHYQNKRRSNANNVLSKRYLEYFEMVAKAMGLLDQKPLRGLNAFATTSHRWKPF